MKIIRWITLGLLCLVLAACGPADQSTPPQAPQTYLWIDAPLDGSTIPLEPYKIVVHGVWVDYTKQFEISINGIVDGSVPPLQNHPGNSNWITYGEYLWDPPAPGSYIISMKVTGPGTNTTDPPTAQARVWVMETDIASEDQPVPDLPTVTIVPPEVEEAAPEPKACSLTALVNLFCRPGPGYDPVDEFTPGQSAPVVAQSEYLWQVNGLNSGRLCTVPKAENLVKVVPKEFCENLPVFTPPATPVPTVSSSQQPQCNDGVDNDNDGAIDLRDSDCSDASDNDESTP